MSFLVYTLASLGELPKMSYEEKNARALAKRRLLHAWVASMKWTTAAVAAELLGCSQAAALVSLRSLVRTRELKEDVVQLPFGKLSLWAITPHGAALAGEYKVYDYSSDDAAPIDSAVMDLKSDASSPHALHGNDRHEIAVARRAA